MIIHARPSLIGSASFLSLPALVFYVVTSLLLVGYAAAVYRLMVQRRRSAIAHNLGCNALAVALLVCWHLLGMKSTFGMVVDGLPAALGAAYMLRSRRVRPTFVMS